MGGYGKKRQIDVFCGKLSMDASPKKWEKSVTCFVNETTPSEGIHEIGFDILHLCDIKMVLITLQTFVICPLG